jgi:hypothetical protein
MKGTQNVDNTATASRHGESATVDSGVIRVIGTAVQARIDNRIGD